MKNRKLIKFAIGIFLILGLISLLRESGASEFFSVAKAQEKVSEFGIWAPIAFIAIFIVTTISFLPVTPLDFVAGAVFGTFLGAIYAIIGATIGATIAFWFTRTFGRPFVQKQLRWRFKKLNYYDKKIAKNGLGTMLFLRLVPLFPFNGLNFAMGLTKISFRDYFIGTFFGIIPGAFAYVYFGESLAKANLANIFISVLLLALLASIYPIYNKFRKKEKNDFDIIVIGAGAGGLNVASFMNKAGFKVLLIDKSDQNIGGDCLNFGCVPSKALIHVAKMVKKSHDASRYGLKVGGVVDMLKIKNHIKSVQEKIRKHENADFFRKQGMEIKLGKAEFVSENQIEVSGEKFKGKKIIIATGSRPRKLQVPGVENVKIYDNETIFDVEKLPKKLLVIGGGPIGTELGQAFKFLGSEVTIVHRGEKGLGKERDDIARILHKKLEKDGIQFYLNSEIKEFVSKKKAVLYDNKNKKESFVEFDAVLVAIGRELNVENLGIEKAGIEVEGSKIKVNKFLQTTNKDVLLVGDVAGGPMFTHAAELHASIILNNFFSPFKKRVNYDKFSWVTFTTPEIATFGINEKELKLRGVKYRTLKNDFKDDDRALTDEYSESLSVLYVGENDKLLGGSVIAPRAGSLVQEFILAMHTEIDMNDMFSKIYPYPTEARVNKATITKLFAKKLKSKLNRRLLRILFR